MTDLANNGHDANAVDNCHLTRLSNIFVPTRLIISFERNSWTCEFQEPSVIRVQSKDHLPVQSVRLAFFQRRPMMESAKFSSR